MQRTLWPVFSSNSCDGFEEKLLALFAEIEATRDGTVVGKGPSLHQMSGTKGMRELKRLNCSVNYEKKDGQTSRGGVKGRGLQGNL